MRISLFVMRGLICQRCGMEIDGQMTDGPRTCADCLHNENADHESDQEMLADRPAMLRPVRVPAAY